MQCDPPLCIFQIPSLVVLELSPWLFFLEDYDDDNTLFNLPNLKKFKVDLYSLNARVLEKLVSSSPSLEDLSFVICIADNSCHTLNLSSPTLKRLDMFLSDDIHILINAPNLESLEVHVIHYQTVPYQVSFVNSPNALLACYIWVNYNIPDIFLSSNFYSGISNVKSLTIIDKKPCPLLAAVTFRRLTRLKLTVCFELCEKALFSGLVLLHQCPVLEVFTFDMTGCDCQSMCGDWSFPDSAPQCLVTLVKKIEIVFPSFVGYLENSLLRLLNYLLGWATALELLRVSVIAPLPHGYGSISQSYDESRLMKEMFEIPRSSPQCQIEFNGLHGRVLEQLEH